jgi:hypothetical protein
MQDEYFKFLGGVGEGKGTNNKQYVRRTFSFLGNEHQTADQAVGNLSFKQCT